MALLLTVLVFATCTVFVAESWAASLFAGCSILLVALGWLRGEVAFGVDRLWILILPGVGLLQLAFGTTVYPHATIMAVLHWTALAAVFLVAQSQAARNRERFLDAFLAFATVEAVLCLAQLHTSHGKVLWLIASGYDDFVYGTFTSYNNFAQFVELAIPIGIVRGFLSREHRPIYVVATGLLFAAVIASSSRSGAMIATAELVIVPVLLARQYPDRWRSVGLTALSIPLGAVAWGFASGWERLLQRFTSVEDLAAGRREFLDSAVAMAVDKPLFGHGLGTFSLVYPRFARIDLPEFVNHAHNDWAEFASEGGFLFALAVFCLFVWGCRPLLRNLWAFGIVAVLIHAAVDYPFARAGVAAWLFAMLGMLAVPEIVRIRRWVPATFAIGISLAAFWLAAADLVYQQDTPAAVERATRMSPLDARYWLRLFDLTRSGEALKTARHLNPHDSRVLIESGLRAELDGLFDQAEQHLQRAAEQDRGWLPKWTLANYCFRHDSAVEFWKWARQAAAAGSRQELAPLFRLATSLDPDHPELIGDRLLPDQPEVLRAFVSFFIREYPRSAAGLESVALRLIAAGRSLPDRNYVVPVVERFIGLKQAGPAVRLWQSMIDRGWLSPETGQSFSAQPLNEGFDWRVYPVDGVGVSTFAGGAEISFYGNQPDFWPPLQKVVAVEPASHYRLRVNGHPGTVGTQWRVLDETTGKEIARNRPAEDLLEFDTADKQLVRIQLFCERQAGSRRASGVIRLASTSLTRDD